MFGLVACEMRDDGRSTARRVRDFELRESHRNLVPPATTTMAEASSDPNAPWTHVQFDTSIGTFVVELYHRHA